MKNGDWGGESQQVFRCSDCHWHGLVSASHPAPFQGLPPQGTSFSGNTAPGGTLAPFWQGRYHLESSHPYQQPGHILALDIKVQDTDVVYQNSKGPIGEVGGGLPQNLV